MKDSITRLDYCQYLLVSQINYTLTNFADHSERFCHDTVNRYLRRERITPHLVWENVSAQITGTEQGYVVFDDTVLDKQYSAAIELVRRQYSGNAHGVFKGIGVAICLYVNPEVDQCWLIDYRIYDPEGDGKSKLVPVEEMLSHTVHHKQLLFHAVLMDTWYATKGFPKHHKVQCFRVKVSTHRTDFVVTNDTAQRSTQATQEVCGFRWKIEQLHQESKQVTGLEASQCRKARIQRNPIGCALLVWGRLKQLATQTGTTIYQLKQGLLDDYLCQQLKAPSLEMALA